MYASPISFPIFGENFVIDPPSFVTLFGFRFYLYGFFITAGYILAGLYCYIRRDTLKLTKDNILDIVIMAVPCGLVGARIYFIIFNAADYFGPGKWQNIFMLREGGLAVYGGVIASGIAFLIYSRIKKLHVGKLLDAAGFGLFIGQAVGRWGNFFNREAYGIVTDLPWKMGLTAQAAGITGVPSSQATVYVHPAFLYESLWNVAGLLIIHIFSKKRETRYHGQYFLFYVAWYGLGRFMIEGLRTDSLFLSGTDIRASQLLAALSCAFAAVLLVRLHLRGYRSRVPALAAAGEADAMIAPDDLPEDAPENAEESEELMETPENKTDTDADETPDETPDETHDETPDETTVETHDETPDETTVEEDQPPNDDDDKDNDTKKDKGNKKKRKNK